MMSGIGSVVSALNSAVKGLGNHNGSVSVDVRALSQNGSVDAIVSYLTEHPGQRNAVETAMAANGRSGDLSIVIDRSIQINGNNGNGNGNGNALLGNGNNGIGHGNGNHGGGNGNNGLGNNGLGNAPDLQVSVHGRGATITSHSALPLNTAETGQRPIAVAPLVAAAEARPAVTTANGAAPTGHVSHPDMPRATGPAGVVNSATIAAAIRDGTLPLLILTAIQDGRFGALVAAAREGEQMTQLATAARTIEAVANAFSARGGLSATEIALMVRTGMLADPAAPKLPPVLDPATVQFALRDGPGGLDFVANAAAIDDVAIIPPSDAALARFESGAIRITSRNAVETYGVLGPPASLIIPADAFEGAVRSADDDLTGVESALGLDRGALTAPDTLVAFIERDELVNLRLQPGAEPGQAEWLPGGERSGTLAAGLADLHMGASFREVQFAPERR